MYLLTVSPSALGVVPILNAKAFIFWFLVIDAGLKFVNLDKHPTSEAYIWTMQNWLLYPVRRVAVDFMLNYVYPVTQTIVSANWVLNLIPLAISYANIMLF